MEDLKKYRRKIDIIDEKIISLLAARMALSGRIGKRKNRNNRPIKDLHREKAVITRITADAKSRKLPIRFVKKIFQAIFAQSRRIQGK